jgi:periplasmic divalent cation tolerance protein
MRDILVCLVTCPSKEVGTRLATLLVEGRLAACVNVIDGVQSVYHWQEQVVVDTEVQLIIKTTRAKLEQVQAKVLEHHPYEIPEFIALEPVATERRYADWISDIVAG